MALDVVDYLDQNDLHRVVLVGHSMGGKVAQMMALNFADRVDGLIVLDMAPVTYSPQDPSWKAVSDIILALQEVDMSTTKEGIDQQLQVSIPDPALRAFVWTNIQSKTLEWKIPMDTIASQLSSLAAFQVAQDSAYVGDALFIHGGQSRFVRHAYMDTIAQHFPNHMLTTIRGAGHWVHAEAPDDTLALLQRYLDR